MGDGADWIWNDLAAIQQMLVGHDPPSLGLAVDGNPRIDGIDSNFDAAQEWAHKRYGKAFKRLAE